MQGRSQADRLPGERECVCVCVCACVHVRMSVCVCICVCMRMSISVCVCMCDKRTEMGGYQRKGCILKGNAGAVGEKDRV